MTTWLALSIYLTLVTLGVLAGGLVGAALAGWAGALVAPGAALVGSCAGGGAGWLLARRVVQQWSHVK